jgi:replicative DNA helicase
MAINLNNCDQACFGCIKKYKAKHNPEKGESFKVLCNGIPKDFVPLSVLASLSSKEHSSALSMLDPVAWAAETLDWHCFDADGEIWKRKNPDEYDDWVKANPGKSLLGHSRYHRPYQGEMLRCTAKRKVARIGRQAGKTDALVINALFHMFTKPGIPEGEGFKIIVITPYQSQIEVIFARIMQLIQASPVTQNSLKRNVKAPIYTIELMNGSTIRGFTAGTKSGGNAGSVRGQTGNMLIFDEADYLSAGDIDSALSIVTNHPNATVWMSSTPSGKRERFYQTCMSKTWKEFHYPSSVNPMYSEQQDQLFRESLTEIGYKHEVLAEFGEQEEGVFQNAYVQAARRQYKYGDIPHRSSWTYTVGVDWNDTANGTTIAILGLDPTRNKFVLVDRHIVSREGWTQLAACEKIAEVNRLWKPIAIYLDAGFGGTQFEVLKKFGYDSLRNPTKGPAHPDSKLINVLKQYDFGSKVETRDIFTGMPSNKDAKPFLVESTIRRFEAQDIEIPEADTDLEQQLLSYVIDRITPTGRPVYKASSDEIGDHLLDAVMLSIVAFVLEATPLGKPRFETNITFAGQFGEKLEAPTGSGDTVIKPDLQSIRERQKKDREAVNSRALPSDKSSQMSLFKNKGDLPASNTKRDTSVGIWSWENFYRDGPRPEPKTLGQAENDARKRLGLQPLRLGKPRRKNI